MPDQPEEPGIHQNEEEIRRSQNTAKRSSIGAGPKSRPGPPVSSGPPTRGPIEPETPGVVPDRTQQMKDRQARQGPPPPLPSLENQSQDAGSRPGKPDPSPEKGKSR